MKKNILALAVILNCTAIFAQTEFDAQKFVLTDINGTARYMGMAGAFGALGGDPSAIKDNPAGLGIYRSSEMTGTLNLLMQNSNATWNGTKTSDNLNNFSFTNFSYVKSYPTFRSQNSSDGLLNSNWSFSYNRLRDFNRNSTISSGYQNSSMTDYLAYFTGNIKSADLSSSNDPYNNTSIPWMSELAYQGYLINETVDANGISTWSPLLSLNEQVKPTFSIQESGFLDEYSVGWAGNFSNLLYLGANLNLQSINYTERSQYSEMFGAGDNQSMTFDNNIMTNGAGLNVNFGAILRPIDIVRIGFSVHSPTVFALTDNNYTSLNYYISSSNNGNITTPTGYNSYMLSTPWKFNASAAVILGQRGLLSAEYDYNLNSNTTLMDQNGNSQNYADENTGIKSVLNNVRTLKIGGEYKLTDHFSLRAGYANMSAGTNPNSDKLMRYNTTRTDTEYFINNSTNYLTAGFGYREASWYIDFAYVNKILDETFYPYNSNSLIYAVNPANVKTANNNLVVTLGFKF
ncbi:MAG: hypothetical protein P4L34_08825 [Paludibacter sp.]|nr:hypothetical protein [Paludibacter sp.]